MTKRIEKPFLMVVMLVFIIVSVLHFVRLSLGWDIVIDNWSLPTLVSGFIIVVSAFITYWAWIILNYDEEETKSSKKESDEEFEEGLEVNSE